MIRAPRFWLVCLMSFIPFTAIVGRLAYLQVIRHDDLSARAQRQQTRHQTDPDPRGAILDRSGATLAVSIQGGSCFADPKRVENPGQTAKILSQWLHIPAAPIKLRLEQKKRFVWIARRLEPETITQLKALNLPGISVQPEMRRFCPEESLAAHTIGVTSDEENGLSGVELTADNWLSGKNMPFLFKQWETKPVDRSPAHEDRDWPAHSIVLTLDRTLQTIVEQELAVQMKLSRPKTGTVIVQDPQTGEILAMATAPNFNPNLWGVPNAPDSYGPETLRNPAVEQVVEPGSTFKMITAAAALEEHKVVPGDTFFCENGQWKIAGRNIHDHEKEGWLTFTDVISHSSNIGTAKVAIRLGETNLYHYARAFGFGMSSGVGLPGDGTGILRDPHQWRASSLETISFGQEVGVTPLQMVNAYSALANGGLLLEPRLYKGYIDGEGHYREWETRRVVRRVISPKTAVTLRGILRHVVEDGTGKEAQVQGFTVAGKTGTAQKFDNVTHQYHADRYLASFCGMVPAEHPRLVIGVFLDEPKNNYYGGSEAAPLVSRIVRGAANYLHLQQAPVGPFVSIATPERS
jgi:cell division protein FtsI (penicillin-binding protein 3)